MAYTFLQLRGRVNDIPHRPKNQDADEVDALVNESYIALVGELGCYVQTFNAVALTASDGDYDVITDWGLLDFAGMRSLLYSAASGLYSCPLDPTTTDEIVGLRQSNPTATSPAVTYAMADWRTAMLQPLPTAGDTVSGVYSAFPDPMVFPTDLPTRLPPNLHHLIVSHAAAIAMEQVDLNYAMRMMDHFQQGELRRARIWLNNQKSSRPFAPGAHRSGARWPGEYWSRA